MGKRWVLALIGAGACVVLAAEPAAARVGRRWVAPLPTHLTVGDQIFEGDVTGLRAYLDTTQATDPQLFAQLSPDLERLEGRVTAARVVLAVGATVGLASIAYSALGRTHCPSPAVTDPDLGAALQRLDACNDDNFRMSVTAGMLGFGALLAGGVGWLALTPSRSELMSFMNRHNALGREPIRFQIGYDPARGVAHSGVTFSF